MSLVNLVAFLEEGPWCPTRCAYLFPKHPGRADHQSDRAFVIDELVDSPRLSPSPEPWAALWQAIRLHQYAQMLTVTRGAGDVAESLGKAALRLYDDSGCPNIPWQILMHWLRYPPPPPPPWLETIGHAANQLLMASRVGGEFGDQLRSAASSLAAEQLGAR